MADKATRLPTLQAVPTMAASEAAKREIDQISASVAKRNEKKAKADARKTNVPDEVYQRNWQAITDALVVMDAAAKALKSAKGVVQSCYSTAKSDGCNIEAMKRLRAMEKIDTDELDLDMRTVARIAGIVSSPIAETSLMLILGEADKVNYYTQGFTAGKAGDDFASCPYDPGSENAEKWGKGWHAGQAKNMETLGRGKTAKEKPAKASAKLN
ncbi:MAG: hypothetical protein ACK4JB_19995 [Reyranella sp.]